MKLTLEHLSAYIPYGLKGIYRLSDVSSTYKDELRDCTLTDDNVKFFRIYCKPYLRPLSDINKPINHGKSIGINIAKQCGLVLFESQWSYVLYAEYGETPKSYISVTEYNTVMFKYHFDVFNLIPQGIAIDINTLPK